MWGLSSLNILAAASVTPLHYDLVVVGGGSAGLTAAKFAARFKKSVLLVEKARMGGDCTWTGCVPSKTLLSIAKTAHSARTASHGISVGEVKVDMKAVKARIDSVVDKIYTADDSPEALQALGIEVLSGTASFVDAHTLSVDGQPIVADKGVVLATGAGPAPAKIAGLEGVPYLTYEGVFELEEVPRRLTVVGSGPVGCELAQAFSRLGSSVTLVGPSLLKGDEPEAGATLGRVLEAEGVRLVRATADAVGLVPGSNSGAHTLVCIAPGGAVVEVEGDTLLVATGRRPSVAGLGLEAAGIEIEPRSGGIKVDAKLRTTSTGKVPVYAAGDCTGDRQFTHYAGFQGAIAARNALLPLSDAGTLASVPGCTFTAPEVAKVGLTEAEAKAELGDNKVRVVMRQLSKVDRAIAEGEEEGFIKVICRESDLKILGATVVAPGAGDIISEFAVAIDRKLKLPQLATVMHVYPAISIAVQQLAAEVYYETLEKSMPLYNVLGKLGL